MGWTTTDKPAHITPKQYLIDRLNCENEHGKWEVLDAACKKSVFYAAVKRTLPDGTSYVFATIFLYRTYRDGWENFGWKDMDESCGPHESECPERILNLLSPTDSEYALAWRKRCRENIAQAKRRPTLKKGDKVNFKKPIRFNGGLELKSLWMVNPKRLLFTGKNNVGLYKLTRALLADPNTYSVIRKGKKIHG